MQQLNNDPIKQSNTIPQHSNHHSHPHIANKLRLKEQIRNKNYKEGRRSRNSEGAWKYQENLKYLQFLKSNKKTMQSATLRRRRKVFQKMAMRVMTRGPDQCRSHHQKCMKKCMNIDGIIAYLQSIKETFSGYEHYTSFKKFQEQINYDKKIQQDGYQFKNDGKKLIITVNRSLVLSW